MQKKQEKQRTIIIFSTAYLPFVGGAELAVKEITDRTPDYHFILLTARFRRDLPRRERIGNVDIHRMGWGLFSFIDKICSPFLGAYEARRIMRRHNVALFWSIMVSFASGAPFLLKLVGLHRRTPILLTLQEGDSEHHLRHAHLGLNGLAWRAAVRMADHIQVISTYLQRFAVRMGATAPITVVPNGVDREKFKVKNEKLKMMTQDRKTKLGIGEKEKVIITTSRLVEKNAIDVLIRAFAIMRAQGIPVLLLILGTGPEERRLHALASHLGIGEAIVWAGLVEYNLLPDYLVLGDVFARPSRSEGLGTAFLEAMAAGLPVVGTPVGGIPDFLKDGDTGLMSRVDDPEDLAKKITQIFQDTALCDKMVVRARRLVEERYQWESVSHQMQKLFSDLAHRPLRVLIATPLYPPDIGGPATYAETLFNSLPKCGISVSILSFSVVRHLPRVIRHLVYGLRVLRQGWNSDTIFALDPVSVGLPAFLAARLLRKPFVVKIVGDYAWEQSTQRFGVTETLDDFVEKKYGWQTEFLKYIQAFVAAHAMVIITPSAYLQRIVCSWGVDEKNILVVYNAVVTPDIRESRKELRRALQLEGKVIFSAGRLVPWKGFALLIRAVADIRKLFPDARLLIAGDGPERERLKFIIKNEKLEKYVTLLGKVPHEKLLRHIVAADIFVLNTAYEGFSHQLLEVMAIGTPIITTAVGGNMELLADGISSLFISYNNKPALVSATKQLLGDTVLGERLARRAKAEAGRFTQTRMIQETVVLLEQTATR